MENNNENKVEITEKGFTQTSCHTSDVTKEKNFAKEAGIVSVAIILGSLIIAGAIVSLSPKMMSPGTGQALAPQEVAPTAEAKPLDPTAVTSLDDDPILGDKTKAKVAIVEFTDFECPFCKRFHADTFDGLVKDFVDTGKAVIVTRDFPLSFHEPKATEDAALAECVRKEKGDAAYFAFTKVLYQNTAAGGKGLAPGKTEELIRKAGANAQSVIACSTTEAVLQEIAKDMADGAKAGVSGTPSFVIGKIGPDGTVTGERVVGALPLSGFKVIIEKYLAE